MESRCPARAGGHGPSKPTVRKAEPPAGKRVPKKRMPGRRKATGKRESV